MLLFNKKLTCRSSIATDALAELQEILFLEAAENGDGFVLNPNKEHDADIMARVDELAHKYGLMPNKIVPFK